MLPLVWDGTDYTRPLHPTSMSVKQSLEPLSTASITLAAGESVNALDLVKITTPDGKAEIYRVADVTTDPYTREVSVSLEHAACLLGDNIIPESAGRKGTVRELLAWILGHQSRWTLGTVDADATLYAEIGGASLIDCINDLMPQIPGYACRYVIDDTGWHVDIVERPTAPACEARLRRNMSTCEISYSQQGLCTRVYCDGITGGKMDSENISVYGVHEETMPLDSSLSKAQKEAIVAAHLSAHDHPAISISISGLELSEITGLALDRFDVGTLCRVALPDSGITLNEVIIEKNYPDPINNPEQVSFTLANARPDLSIVVAKSRKRGASNSRKIDQTSVQYSRHFKATDKRILSTMTATGVLLDENNDPVVDEHGDYVFDENGATLSSRVSQTAGQLRTEVETRTRQGLTLSSAITQTAQQIALKVAKGDVATQLSVECGNVHVTGTPGAANLVVDGYVTTAGLEAAIGDIQTLYVNDIVADGGTIQCEDIITSGTGSVSTPLLEADTVDASAIYYNNTDIGNAVYSFGTPTASGGQISIPWTKVDGTAGTPINFNIADTAFYQHGVSASVLSVASDGWAWDSDGEYMYNVIKATNTVSGQTKTGSSVRLPSFSASLSGNMITVRAAASGGTTYPVYDIPLQTKTITADGTYRPDSGKYGFSSVTVSGIGAGGIRSSSLTGSSNSSSDMSTWQSDADKSLSLSAKYGLITVIPNSGSAYDIAVNALGTYNAGWNGLITAANGSSASSYVQYSGENAYNSNLSRSGNTITGYVWLKNASGTWVRTRKISITAARITHRVYYLDDDDQYVQYPANNVIFTR